MGGSDQSSLARAQAVKVDVNRLGIHKVPVSAALTENRNRWRERVKSTTAALSPLIITSSDPMSLWTTWMGKLEITGGASARTAIASSIGARQRPGVGDWKCQAGLAPSRPHLIWPHQPMVGCFTEIGGAGLIAGALCMPADDKLGCNKAAGGRCLTN